MSQEAKDLEDLVSFLASHNRQIRAAAVEHLVPYSLSNPEILKVKQLLPVKNLKVLIQDRPELAHNALTILINLSVDNEVLKLLATDDKFIDVVLTRLTNPLEPNADLLAMLMANLAKWDGLEQDLLVRERQPPTSLKSNDLMANQLLDLFVQGSDQSYNKDADFDYLAYLFADLAKHADFRGFLLKEQTYDKVRPLTKLKVFTEHKSDIRRRGVANTVKNVAIDTETHADLLSADGIDILPYILLPITGNEDYDEDDTMSMLPELQLLGPEKQRDADPQIIQTHIETLLLLTQSASGRKVLQQSGVYPIIRETHLRVQDEGVREICERLVQVLMGDEEEDGNKARGPENDDDMRIVEV